MPDSTSRPSRPYTVTDLRSLGIDPDRGFLPSTDPLDHLPAAFSAWDRLGAELPTLLTERRFRAAALRLPVLPVEKLHSSGERERAMLLLTCFVNAYVWEGPIPAQRVPAAISVPLCRLADELDRPAISTHAAMVLANWRQKKPGSFLPEDLETLVSFRALDDESWFFLVTVGIEAITAKVLPTMIDAQSAVVAGNVPRLTEDLELIATAIHDNTAMLARMFERCRPAVFFSEIRPWLTGWPQPGVIYEGVDEAPRMLSGGSAAQSASIQAFDAVLGVQHPSPVSGPFLAEMRRYMPPRHRHFLEHLDNGPSVADFVRQRAGSEPALTDGYQRCCEELSLFRKGHLEIAARYITAFVKNDPNAKGTGGTDFGAFLGTARRETLDAKAKVDPAS